MYLFVVWMALASGVAATPFRDVLTIVEALTDVAPAGLRTEAAWKEWAGKRDREIRSRLVQGDEDSLANLLVMGTSFTRQPRVSGSFDANRAVIDARISDFIRALDQPGL